MKSKESLKLAASSKIPRGYKHTELGVLPVEWKVKRLGEVGIFLKGCGISKDDICSSGIPCIRYGELYTTYKETINKVYSKTKLSKDGLVLSKINDILIPASGETAVDIATASCILLDNVAIGGDITIIRTRCNGIYLSYCLNHPMRKHIAALAQGATVIHLYSNILKQLKIPVPPIKEQEKIVEILSHADEMINQCEKLIALKEKYKKGLMQRLLALSNAKSKIKPLRFKEFKSKWKIVRLGDILDERKEYQTKDMKLEHLSLTKEGIFPKSERYDRDFLVKSKHKEYKVANLNDICYNPANLKFGVICRNTFGKGIFSPIYVTFEVKKGFNIDFIEYFLTWETFIKKVRKYEQGTLYERMAVSPEDFLSFTISIPSLQEQEKIVEILNLSDKEIKLLKDKLNALKMQKKGLMQRLLSGALRVK